MRRKEKNTTPTETLAYMRTTGVLTMKAQLAATVFCALLAAQSALAQQDQPRSTTPSRAEPTATSNPLPDPHKDGGRPESHGGTVHAPQVGAGATLPAEMRPVVEELARSTVTAQQYGNLASKRHTSGVVHELGDRMVLTNSRINRGLMQVMPDLRDSAEMPASERATFDNLARDADEMQFGVSIAQWVAQTYPQAISALERLGQQGALRDMAAAAVPEMRSQLTDAQRILQSASASPSGQPTSTGATANPKTKSD
jgi:hypothetical protein